MEARLIACLAASDGADTLQAVRAAVGRRGWTVVHVIVGTDRDQLARCTKQLRAAAVVVPRLLDLAGSVEELRAVFEAVRPAGLIALDAGLPVVHLTGERHERELQRQLRSALVKQALDERRRQGRRLGAPRRCPDEVLDMALRLRRAGLSQAAVADELNTLGVPTPGGGERWYASHVSRLLQTQDARARSAAG